MTKKTGKKWSTNNCGRCGSVHLGYSGKLDSKGVEYIVCGETNKRINMVVSSNWFEDEEMCEKCGMEPICKWVESVGQIVTRVVSEKRDGLLVCATCAVVFDQERNDRLRNEKR